VKRYVEKVQYKPVTGPFRKVPRTKAHALILADYDRSPHGWDENISGLAQSSPKRGHRRGISTRKG